MPKTEVVFFADDDGSAPAVEWLKDQPTKIQDKLIVLTERLAEVGHELRRPLADFLRDGIHELRAKRQTVNYRLLYFFSGKIAVIAHGCTKESAVADRDINLAVRRKELFEGDPEKHTYVEE